ncbi:MAG: Iron-sulfur cluster carrier protein [Mycoplasmataceae bacterium]|nr:MAG: Iron-sulfur cluster carrier protein [Mycoplasmataceae bacterium]
MIIIAFISQKGGVGKSTLARATAWEANRQDLKVLLADCDPQQETSYEWAKLKKEVNCQVFKSIKEVWSLASQHDLIIIDAPPPDPVKPPWK